MDYQYDIFHLQQINLIPLGLGRRLSVSRTAPHRPFSISDPDSDSDSFFVREMLARIPPPHLSSPLIQNHRFTSSSLRSAYSLRARLYLAPRRPSRCAVPQALDASGRRQYDRIPMDTAGAYRMVDRETGETFIVWGASDDDDSSVPSEKVLSWRPGANEERKVGEQFLFSLMLAIIYLAL